MIGMIKSVSGGGALFNYVCKPSKGFEVDRNLVSGITPKEIFDDFKVYIEQNQRASKKIFSMVLKIPKFGFNINVHIRATAVVPNIFGRK